MPKYKFVDIAINMTKKRKPTDEDMETYIGLEHLDTGSLAVTRWGSKVPIKGDKLIMKKGDILFGKRNAYLKRAAIAPHDGLFSAHGMILRPNKEVISPKLFPFFICSDYFFDAAIRISVGSLSPTINWSALKELEFTLPNMDEQEKLAELLWAANNAKETYKKLINISDQLVKSQFNEMFIDDSKEVPLSDYVIFQEGPGVRSVNFTDEGTILLTGSNINNNTISFGYTSDRYISNKLAEGKYAHFMCDKGDILVVTSAIDPNRFDEKVVVVNEDKKYCLNTGIIRFKPDKKYFTQRYFIEFLKSDYFKQQVMKDMVGIAQMHFGPSHLKKMSVLIPNSMEKQNIFSEFVQQKEKLKFELKQNISNLEKTIKAIMSKNFG